MQIPNSNNYYPSCTINYDTNILSLTIKGNKHSILL